MYLMADAVACLRIVDAVLLSDRTDIFVVVRILEAGLQGIVVNVSDRTLERIACDYVAGMTDRYSIAVDKNLFIPKSWNKIED